MLSTGAHSVVAGPAASGPAARSPGREPHEPELQSAQHHGDARRIGSRLHLRQLGSLQSDYPLAASGLALMTYSYFITSIFWLVAVGVAIAVAPFAWRRIA